MPNYAPKLPLEYNQGYGPYTPLEEIQDVVKQNLKMLILTNPGERIMMPSFGVGIRRTLFENKSPNYNSIIESRIKNQVNSYLPFIEIKKIVISDLVDNLNNFYENSVQVSIYYNVPTANISDILNLNINNTQEG